MKNQNEQFQGKGTLTIPLDSTFISYRKSKDEPCYNGLKNGNKNPHYGLWHRLLNYLSRRGFKITGDPRIEEHYPTLSKNHRCGIKNNLEFKTKRFPTGFRFTFFQNINTDNPSGGQYDTRKYQRMPYLIKLSYRNEAQRLADFAESIGVKVNVEHPMNDEEKIINDKDNSLHTNRKITSLDDIQHTLSDYDHKRNSWDRDKKKISCGETKYFYDRNGSICRGQVYHHINNMWWVLVNGKRHNIASFKLFDYTPDTPKKKPLSPSDKIDRLQSELRKAEKAQNYERCIELRDVIQRQQDNQSKAA